MSYEQPFTSPNFTQSLRRLQIHYSKTMKTNWEGYSNSNGGVDQIRADADGDTDARRPRTRRTPAAAAMAGEAGAGLGEVIEFEPGKRAVGVKKITANEEFFNGHFPSRPIMPGVLQVEAMAQVPASGSGLQTGASCSA